LAVAPTLLSDEFYERLAEFCKGQANPKRLKIINLLANGEKSVSEISNILNIPQANLSQHLSYMRRAGRSKVQERGGNGLLQAGGRAHSSGLQPSQTDDDGEVWVRKPLTMLSNSSGFSSCGRWPVPSTTTTLQPLFSETS
jgi:DNA-binding transcriptional ArsR family regulator